jgi:hypothetical protein
MLALQIRSMVERQVHKQAINSANGVLDRFVTAMEQRKRK